MQISKGIGKVKKANNIRILQTNRWDDILNSMMLKGQKKGLSEEFINRLFKAIHQESINIQTKIMNE